MRAVRPDFHERFACKAADCRHSCCRGWEIDVDPATAAYYRSLPGPLGEELRASLEGAGEDRHFRLTESGDCPFLRPDGLCRLIRALGEDALCDICTLHPRFFGELGDFELCGLGLSCEKSCELLLESSGPLTFLVDGISSALNFAGLLRLFGAEAGEESLCFRPEPSQARYEELLRRLSETEPIDDTWPEELARLRARLPELTQRARDYAAACDQGRYDRIFHYIAFRQLERLENKPLPALLDFARGSAEFIFMQDALYGVEAEHLRRWSEQIEYSTDNVERLLAQAASSSPAIS